MHEKRKLYMWITHADIFRGNDGTSSIDTKSSSINDSSCCVSASVWQVEKQRADLSRELEDLSDRLEEAGGISASQVHPLT